jgi:putative colanic acid biosynthesis UDP-glucose lipid carrier transferase
MIVIEKYLYRVIYAKTRKNNKNIKSTLVVGNKNISNFLNGSNLSNNNLNLNIIGILNDDDDGKNGYKLLGSIHSIHQILQEITIDQVLVCLPIDEEEKIDFIVSACEKESILVSILTSPTNQFGIGTKRVMNYANIPILFFKNYPLDDFENQLFKRIFDIIFSIFVIIFIFSWLFPIVFILIKLTSKGPIFFNQYRWGINNERIKCYKFRTMFIGSNELATDGSYMPAKKDDQRITPIGKFLRKTSIDEMPQFLNVLIGSMSIVGPRPHPIPLNIQSKEQIHNYLLRHLVKPGISGWAQVNGNRGEVKELSDMQDRVNFDIWYIENWTLWLDIQIIFQTVINLIKGDEKAF